jgi:hypothetical protein
MDAWPVAKRMSLAGSGQDPPEVPRGGGEPEGVGRAVQASEFLEELCQRACQAAMVGLGPLIGYGVEFTISWLRWKRVATWSRARFRPSAFLDAGGLDVYPTGLEVHLGNLVPISYLVLYSFKASQLEPRT